MLKSFKEKIKIEKVVHEKFKLNIVNQKQFLVEHCVRKILSCMRKKLSCIGEKKLNLKVVYEKKY